MAGLDERRDAMESRYVHDEELRFRIRSRRDRYLGAWAAGRMGRTGAAAGEYALDVATSRYPGDHDALLVARVGDDLSKNGVSVTDAEIRERLAEANAKATSEILTG